MPLFELPVENNKYPNFERWGGVCIVLFSKMTPFEYKVSTILSPIVVKQWQIQGRCPGGRSPLFIDQTEARRAGKNFGDRLPTPYLRVWMTTPSPTRPFYEGLDPPLFSKYVLRAGFFKSRLLLPWLRHVLLLLLFSSNS